MTNRVKIEPSGHEFSVNRDESVLDAAIRQGVHLPYGCRNGKCGKCLGKVVQGEVQYTEQPTALSNADQATGMALFCQAQARTDLVIESREAQTAKDISVVKLPCRLEALEKLNHDVMYLKLKLPETERMQFLAGQYIDFLLKDGKHRSFSIANAPHNDEYIELHIRHISEGKFTTDVFASMKVKEMFRIEGPHGNFYIREDSNKPMIFMAGGTGFAPVKGMVEHALKVGIERPIHIYWGARAFEDLYMDDVAQKFTKLNPLIRYTPVLSNTKDIDNWQGRTGWVHEAILNDYPDLSGHEVYAAGPPAMVYAAEDAFTDAGLSKENYISDAFEFNKD